MVKIYLIWSTLEEVTDVTFWIYDESFNEEQDAHLLSTIGNYVKAANLDGKIL